MTDEAKALVERLRELERDLKPFAHKTVGSIRIDLDEVRAIVGCADLIEELDRHLTLSGKVSKALSDRIETLETQLESANEALRERLDICETQARDIERLNAILSEMNDTDVIAKTMAEIERLRKLTCATWFYMPDESERCWFSPHEVIDQMYDPEPGNHVFEVECARSLPSIWCAVRVTDDPDADERFTFTEHATEEEARAALGDSHD